MTPWTGGCGIGSGSTPLAALEAGCVWGSDALAVVQTPETAASAESPNPD